MASQRTNTWNLVPGDCEAVRVDLAWISFDVGPFAKRAWRAEGRGGVTCERYAGF